MSDKCGDDLIAARKFMNLCRDHMSEIFSGGQIPVLDVVDKLGEIQSHAKLMHARSIYRSAQDVIDDLTGRRNVQSCAGSVLVLQKLIRQYERGLSEIAPVAKQVIRQVRENPVGLAVISELSQQKQAAETLRPLVKFAAPEDRQDLNTLLKLAANEARPAARKSSVTNQKIDVILPMLTNHWLRLARTQGKSISVSSCLDDMEMDRTGLWQLQAGLKHLGELLISQSVETPDIRESRSLSRSAHLALTARQTDGGLEVLLSCEGQSPRDSDFALISETLEKSAGYKPHIHMEDNLIRIEMTVHAAGENRTSTTPAREASL